ncbi:MAG: response regulator [Brevundimonas sp.]|uniref:response regulator n=1 Tax=Brevundimonas sp. TaxID=1871086 RepID=UPI002ABCB380|nr:response regulator [Brevundimonas sp.]MDZ4113505.1 response regulator [Brevundimonas sp.]
MTLTLPGLADGAPLTAWDSLRRAVWLFDPDTCFGVYANRAALALWGATDLEELLSRDFSKLSPAVRARTDRLKAVTAGGEPVEERWTFYPNGEPLTVQALISTVALDDGRKVLLFEATEADVGVEERRAVEALRHSAGPIGLFDAAGAALFANPGAFSTYGEAVSLIDRFEDRNAGQAVLDAALDERTTAEVHRMVTLKGLRWHHIDCRPVQDPVTGAVSVLMNERDVTDRVEAEAARAAAEQKVAMAEARQRFLSDMSHELRTPLNAVMGFADVLDRSGLNPDQAAHLARITAAGEALHTVVERMIDLSQRDDWGGAIDMDDLMRPKSSVAASDAAVPVADEEPDEDEGRAMVVLYVDDNESNRVLVSTLLTAQGVVCETADDGAEGVAAARRGGWDVILMDIQMPVMDGVEATRRIRALGTEVAATPIIALTANTLAEQLELYFAVGMDDCIAKPLNAAEMFDKLFTQASRPWRDEWAEASAAAA